MLRILFLLFWQGQKDLILLANCARRSVAALTVHRTVIHYRSPSSPSARTKNKRNRMLRILFLLFWQGQKDLILLANCARRSVAALTVHRTVIHYRSPSSPSARTKNKRNRMLRILFLLFWQGQKDLNPRPMVLETSTLPTELYPYIRAILYQKKRCLSRVFLKKLYKIRSF